MSAITTHVLDTSQGRPGSGIRVTLEFLTVDGWQEITTATTNKDGRVPDLLDKEHKLEPGIYRLSFETKTYFESQSVTGFYPYVPVTFEIKDPSQHYHVPLLISPFGYSTYRGS